MSPALKASPVPFGPVKYAPLVNSGKIKLSQATTFSGESTNGVSFMVTVKLLSAEGQGPTAELKM